MLFLTLTLTLPKPLWDVLGGSLSPMARWTECQYLCPTGYHTEKQHIDIDQPALLWPWPAVQLLLPQSLSDVLMGVVCCTLVNIGKHILSIEGNKTLSVTSQFSVSLNLVFILMCPPYWNTKCLPASLDASGLVHTDKGPHSRESLSLFEVANALQAEM